MKVKHLNSKTANSSPAANKLDYGEIAVNYNASNPKLFIKDTTNAVVSFPSEGTVNSKFTTVNNTISGLTSSVNGNTASIETINDWVATPLTTAEIQTAFA